jgi:hypothetical protein
MTVGAPAVQFARCFLRLVNLPNFALDRLSRYEAGYFTLSKRWIAANHKSEPAVYGLQAKIKSSARPPQKRFRDTPNGPDPLVPLSATSGHCG